MYTRTLPRTINGANAAFRDATYASALERPAPMPRADRIVVAGAYLAGFALLVILIAEYFAR
jgi:hypothetical protein